tara:strand:+ start:68548 stop:68982 length:435 start_codon:yes stop_codon:yes gene_type:complete
MANIIYTNYLEQLCSGTINLISDPIYAMLLSGDYVPNTGDMLVADIASYEAEDTSASPEYLPGGYLLASKNLSVSAGEIVFDAADVTVTTATIQASGVALWASGATAADHHLISWTELGDTSSTNGTFQIVWSSTDGIFKVGAT